MLEDSELQILVFAAIDILQSISQLCTNEFKNTLSCDDKAGLGVEARDDCVPQRAGTSEGKVETPCPGDDIVFTTWWTPCNHALRGNVL